MSLFERVVNKPDRLDRGNHKQDILGRDGGRVL